MQLGPAASIGRIVHVNIGADTRPGYPHSAEQLRPAIVVRTWGDQPESAVNAQLFTDGTNDAGCQYIVDNKIDPTAGQIWLTSITQGDGVGQWRWPARV